MISASLELTKTQLDEAVREWLEKRGIATTDRLHVAVESHPGDRPFDSTTYTTITVTGVVIGSIPKEGAN